MIAPLSELQMRQLVNNLNPARVASRSQGGARLSYLEAWDVRATMIRVFGFGGWSADLTEGTIVRIDEVPSSKDPSKKNFRVLAQATVKVYVPQLDCSYTETAAASQTGPDIGEVSDFALKTAESDAFKRCCVNFGTQMGMSLYDSGKTEDVVRVVLAPGQNETLALVRATPEERKVLEAQAQKDPEPPAPGEDPRDDLPAAEQPMWQR